MISVGYQVDVALVIRSVGVCMHPGATGHTREGDYIGLCLPCQVFFVRFQEFLSLILYFSIIMIHLFRPGVLPEADIAGFICCQGVIIGLFNRHTPDICHSIGAAWGLLLFRPRCRYPSRYPFQTFVPVPRSRVSACVPGPS